MLYFKPIRFARFDNESVNRGLTALEPAKAGSRSLVLTKRIAASGGENDIATKDSQSYEQWKIISNVEYTLIRVFRQPLPKELYIERAKGY